MSCSNSFYMVFCALYSSPCAHSCLRWNCDSLSSATYLLHLVMRMFANVVFTRSHVQQFMSKFLQVGVKGGERVKYGVGIEEGRALVHLNGEAVTVHLH